MKFNFKITNIDRIAKHYDRTYRSISSGVEKELNSSAKKIQRDAKNTIIRNNNIITGQLLRSITGDVLSKKKYNVKSNFTLRAYSRVFYAIYVERLYPYLFPAWEQERHRLIRRLKKMVG